MSDGSRAGWLKLGGILLATFLLRVGHFWGPTFRDEGIFGLVAQEVLRGHLPLSTVYENKGVLLFYEQALALAIGGFGSIASIRCMGALLGLVALVAFYALLKDQFDEPTALTGTALLGFHWSLIGVQGNYYGSEMFAVPPCIVASYFLWRACKEGRVAYSAVGGVLLSLAVWTRLTTATFVIAMAVFLVVGWQGHNRWRGFLAYSLGGILASVPFLALYAIPGQLGLLQEAYLGASDLQFSVQEVGGTPMHKLRNVFVASAPHVSLLVLGLGLVPMAGWWKDRRTVYHMVWLAAGILAVLLPAHYLIKQAHQFYAPLCALLAWHLRQAWLKGGQQRSLMLLTVLSCLTLSCCLNFPTYYRLATGDPSVSEEILVSGERVAGWIRDTTQPEEEMFLWGVEWEVYFRAQRRSPVRQINLAILVMTGLGAQRIPTLVERFESEQKAILDALNEQPPRVMVVTAGLKDNGIPGYWLPAEIEKIVDRDYQYQFYDKPYYVFLRKEVGGPSSP